MEQGSNGSGVRFFTLLNGIDDSRCLASFSFDYDYNNINYGSNLVHPDSWNIYSATGVLNTNNIVNFYQNSGVGSFDGNTLMRFDRDLSLYRTDRRGVVFDSALFITFERQRQNNEILISSLGGTGFSNYSGFCLGINDANKLYFKYWNPIDGQFSHTFPNILANKNSIFLQTQLNNVSIGILNNNTKNYEISNFEIFRNTIRDSNNLVLGGSNAFPEWLGSNIYNFSGKIDNFYLFRNLTYLDVKNVTSGFIYNPQSIDGTITEECYTDTVFSGSGFFVNEVTGIEIIDIITGSIEITGILTGISGILTTGITGYEAIEIGRTVDNCGFETINYRYDPLTGEYIVNVPYSIDLTGYLERSGVLEIELTGLVEKFIDLEVSTLVCNDILFLNSIPEYYTGIDFLKSLSFSEISLISKTKKFDSLEVFCDDFSHDPLLVNRSLDYDRFNQTHYFNENLIIKNDNDLVLFANGQALIESGYFIEEVGYDTNIIPNFDYAITGNDIITNKKFNETDYLFYDYITGNFYAFKSSETIQKNSKIIDIINNSDNSFIYLNGQKLLEGKDYNISGSNELVRKFSGSNNIGWFGSDVETSENGDVLLVGSVFANNGGIVFIYTGNKKDSNWQLKQSLPNNGTTLFGGIIKINHNNSIILTYGERQDLNSGVLFIYTGNPNLGWNLKQSITGEESFGGAIDISNDNIIVVGSYWNENGFGSTFLYTGDINNGWSFKQLLTGTPQMFNTFGGNVSINDNGSLLAVSARAEDTAFGINAGAAYIYTGNVNSEWVLKQKLITGVNSLQFGHSLKLSKNGKTLMIGAPNDGINQNLNAGSAFIYTGDINNQWVFKQKLLGSGVYSQFGMSCNTNYDGSRLFLGRQLTQNNQIFGFTITNTNEAGLIYTGSNVNGWNIEQKINVNNITKFGPGSFNKRGDLLLMGAPLDDELFSAGGTASIYQNKQNFFTRNALSGQNYFIIKEYPDSLNKYLQTGNINTNKHDIGSLKINSNFNHGCSHVYFNGIRQKINNNYVENSNFDMLSGTFDELDIKEILYNNTDDFFNQN